jgi:hypothetical protein
MIGALAVRVFHFPDHFNEVDCIYEAGEFRDQEELISVTDRIRVFGRRVFPWSGGDICNGAPFFIDNISDAAGDIYQSLVFNKCHD